MLERDGNQLSRPSLRNWAAIAEISSAIAVVLSLLYVGFEIRRTTLESDADIQAELLSYTHHRRYLVVENGELAQLLAAGYADPSSLTPGEALRFQKYIELHFVAWERAFDANFEGVFSNERFAAWDVWFTSVAAQDPAFVWPMVRDSQTWSPPFADHVDAVLNHAQSALRADRN